MTPENDAHNLDPVHPDSLPLEQLLPGRLAYEPGMDLETFAKAAPARWVVYLMSDESDRPVQLLCVKNLRQSLRRRLGGEDTLVPGASKRVDYRQLIRRISYALVDSALEADWIYYEAARRVFPGTYQGMVGLRPAWFVHVDPDARFPKYTKTIDLAGRTGELIGPLEDKHAAARLMELAEDAFDLCRYYNVLIQAPNGSACAYKEMGKCPAPCDGTISIEQYRWLVRWSAQTIVDPEPFIRDQKSRMEQAAAALRFETAGKIKAFVSRLSELGKRGLRAARRLDDFRYVSIQPGGRAKCVKVFLIWPGGIEIIACVRAAGERVWELVGLAAERMELHQKELLDSTGVERIGIISQHLFSKRLGAFLPLGRLDDRALAKAIGQVIRNEPAESETQDEGVVRELASMDDVR